MAQAQATDAAAALDTSVAALPPKKNKGNDAPAFKNPLALTEPTKEMLVPVVMVFGASVASWIVGRYKFSVLWSLVFGGGVAFAIRTLKENLTRAACLMADRNAQRKRVVSDEETCEWINATLYRFWQFYEPVLCQTVRDAVQPTLDDLKPAGLTGIVIQRFTLGKRPPFVASARFLTKDNRKNEISENRIILNMEVGLHAPDLEVVVAAQTAVASLPIAVKNIIFQGKLHIEVELVPEFPHAKTAIVTFLEKPFISVDVVPLKSVNIFDVPGLSEWIHSLIINGVNDNLVNPEKLVLDLMPAEVGHVEAAQGVMFVAISDASYKESSAFDVISVGSQEVFAEVKVGKSDAKTQIISCKAGTETFSFNETLSLLVKGNLAGEAVSIYLKQKRLQGEKLLGKVYVPVADVANSPDSTITDKLAFEASDGSINVKLSFCPLSKLTDVEDEEAEEGTTEAPSTDDSSLVVVNAPAPDALAASRTGSLLIRLHGARDLPAADTNGFSDPYAFLYYMDRKLITTPVIKKDLSPTWDCNKEVMVGDIDHVRFTLRVFDADDIGSHDPLGDLDIDLNSLFTADPATGERKFSIEKQWFKMRKPGPLGDDKPKTAEEVMKGQSVKPTGNYGHVQLSLYFRPIVVPGHVTTFAAEVGNPEDDLSITPYGGSSLLGKGVGAVGKGLAAGVGALGAGVGLVGTGVGALGSGVATLGTGAVGILGKGLTETVNITGKAGGGMAKHMTSVATGKKTGFFARKKSSGGESTA